MDLLLRFEQEQVWEVNLSANPFWRRKTDLIRALIPADVRTILDVGCGNGALTHELARTHVVFGLDASRTALAQVTVPAAVAWADHLPVADESIDLALCSEMLEHLPSQTIRRASAELQRIARRWLLVTVPYREHLALRHVWCGNCHQSFHIYGHVQRFTLQRLRTLFSGWNLREWIHCGDHQETYHPGLLFIRQHLGHQWYFDSTAYAICPYCQATAIEPRDGNRVAYWCDRLNSVIARDQHAFYPYWIVTLWERPQ